MSYDDEQKDHPAFPGKIVHETEKAYLADLGEEKPIWLPKSQVTTGPIHGEKDLCEFFIPEWLAKEKGLI